jgi:hypothetical protein
MFCIFKADAHTIGLKYKTYSLQQKVSMKK